MFGPDKRKDAEYPDEKQLKTEIDLISSRIDNIMENVKKHFPGNKEKQEQTGNESYEDK